MDDEVFEFYKKRIRLRSWVWVVLIIISFSIMAISGYKIFFWNKDNKQIEKEVEEINKITNIEDVPVDEEKEELVNSPQDDPNNDYWSYVKLPLINVDFNELKNKNKDTVAFLKVNGTNINYPVVQTNDNKYYLSHSFNKKANDAGWVFLDYRNNIDKLQDNTIIYAHGRLDKTMFGSLKNIFSNNWYKDTDNYVINLSTPSENTLWQVISVYKIPTETYYLTTNFGTEKSHQKFIDTIISRSKYDFGASVNTNDKILTLSTCYNDREKVVLHARLIKKRKR